MGPCRNGIVRLAACMLICSSAQQEAGAQAFPTRPINVVVPSGAGGPQDTVARIVTERMQHQLGAPVVIENVPGATGTIGMARVARAAPDGYTLAFSLSFSTHVVNAAVQTLPFDVAKDFEPIALVAESPQIILAKKDLAANTLMQLITWLKANPDKALLGNTGPGSPAQVAGVLFQKLTGTRFQFVSYRSAGQAMQDLVAGHIDLMFTAPIIALPAAQGGKVKTLAVTARNRLAAAPNILTVDEAGLTGLHTAPWFALWAPKGTPPPVIAKLNGVVVEALANPTVRERFTKLALDVPSRERQTPEALRVFHQAEIEKWWPILKEAGIKLN
jgi:tripartite-type tricarboxylate transporter receptor subunit TctC